VIFRKKLKKIDKIFSNRYYFFQKQLFSFFTFTYLKNNNLGGVFWLGFWLYSLENFNWKWKTNDFFTPAV
jgi:hypothetical protein